MLHFQYGEKGRIGRFEGEEEGGRGACRVRVVIEVVGGSL